LSGKQRHDAFGAVLKTLNLNTFAEFYRELYVENKQKKKKRRDVSVFIRKF